MRNYSVCWGRRVHDRAGRDGIGCVARDEGVGGNPTRSHEHPKWKRAAHQIMLHGLKRFGPGGCRKSKKKVKYIVIADLSRFARNSRNQANFMFELQQIGIKVVSIDEPMIDDTPVGKFLLTIKGATNEMFSNELSEKTKFRMQEAVKKGRFPWVAPLGYLNNTKDKTIEVDPVRGPLVADALKRVAKGEQSGKVLADINTMGLRTRKGDPVPKQTWGKMLANEIYCGWVVSGDLRVRGTHTPLISEKVFEKILGTHWREEECSSSARPR